MYKTIVCLGAPKSGTNNLCKFFDNSNYCLLRYNETNDLDCGYKNFIDEKNLDNTFCSISGWIDNKEVIKFLVNHLRDTKSLFIVCIREFNHQLKAFYECRKRQKEIYRNMTFDEFKNSESPESKDTYMNNMLKLEENILYLISLIKDNPNFNLLILDHKYKCNMNLIKLFNNYDINLKNDNYKFEPHEIKTKVDQDDNIFNAYLKLINNDEINKYMIKNINTKLDYYIRDNNIKQLYNCSNNLLCDNLDKYNDKNKKTLFYGLTKLSDFIKLRNHKGGKYIYWDNESNKIIKSVINELYVDGNICKNKINLSNTLNLEDYESEVKYDYNNNFDNTLFYINNNNDLIKLENHKGDKWILWENIDMLNDDNVKRIKNSFVICHYCYDNSIYNKLIEIFSNVELLNDN